MCIVGGLAGKVHDARVFRNSPLFAALPGFTGMNHIIDGAYPISRYLMAPFSDNVTFEGNRYQL